MELFKQKSFYPVPFFAVFQLHRKSYHYNRNMHYLKPVFLWFLSLHLKEKIILFIQSSVNIINNFD